MIEDKKSLAAELFSGNNEINLTKLDDDELLDLVMLDIYRVL